MAAVVINMHLFYHVGGFCFNFYGIIAVVEAVDHVTFFGR